MYKKRGPTWLKRRPCRVPLGSSVASTQEKLSNTEKLLKDKGDEKDFAEASSQLTQSLSQLRAIEALKKNIKLKK